MGSNSPGSSNTKGKAVLLFACRVAFVVLVSCAFGTVANFANPRRIEWVENWAEYVEAQAYKEGIALADVTQARRIVNEGRHIIFDARPAEDYYLGHLPGAMSLPFEEVDERFPEYAPILTPDQPILTYCSGTDCDESLRLTKFLREQEITNVVLFAGGWAAWERWEVNK